MAELIGLGASVLSIAALGASIVTRLRTFSSSYSGADQKMADLAADIALTASILTEIGHTFEEYEKEFHLKADNFARAKATCEKNFERLEKALRQARKSETADFTILGKNLLTGEQQPIRPWEKLKYALGGDQELKELVMSIEAGKSNLQLLLDSINLLVLKKLNTKHLLNADQAEDLQILIKHIPLLFKSLQQSDFVNTIPSKTTPLPTRAGPGNGTVHDGEIGGDSDKSKNLSSTAPVFTRHNLESSNELEDIDSINSKAAVNQKTQVFSGLQANGPTIADNTKQSIMDRGDSDIRFEGSSLRTSRDFYEGWLLANRYRSKQLEPTVVKFCGLRIKVHRPLTDWDRDRMDDCSITPFSLDEAWLKKKIAVVNDRKTQAESRKLIRSTISSFTISAREEIQRLLQWRNDSAPKPYAWQVEAIAKYNEHMEASLATGSQWILILKGGLLSSDNGILPTRDRNPWLLAPPSNPPTYNLGQVDPQRRYDINIPFHDDRPTYTRMSRRHVSLETLNQFRVAFELDKDPEYVLIKRWVPEDEQDAIWTHTRDLRERRRHSAQVSLTKPSVSELSTDSSVKLEYFVKSKPRPKWKFKKGKKSQVAVPEEEKEGEPRIIREGDSEMNGLYGSPRIYDFDAEAGQRGAALHGNDLLPQDEAERLIDEFLETFVEGSSDAKTSND